MSPWLFQTPYISIHMYGFCIAAGLCFYTWCLSKDAQLRNEKLLDNAYALVSNAIIAGIIGGRILWFLEFYNEISWYDFINLSNPGFSLLGSVIAVLAVMFFAFKNLSSFHRIILVNKITLYAPLLIAAGRIGCLFAGCCYGQQSYVPWSITYTDPEVLAPLGVSLHPTQLYSAIFLLVSFLVMYVFQNRLKGYNVALLSLILIFLERFSVDFFRDNRTLVIGSLSFHQVISATCLITIFLILYLRDYAQR